MGVVVSFDPAAWAAQFPNFAYLSSQQSQSYFDMATTICRNDGGGPVPTAAIQTALLNVLTAHIAQLFAPPQGGGAAPSPGVVGRISNASEGSVSVATEFDAPQAAAWYAQTQYGAMFWEMSKSFRTARYLPGPARATDPWPVYGQYWNGRGLW